MKIWYQMNDSNKNGHYRHLDSLMADMVKLFDAIVIVSMMNLNILYKSKNDIDDNNNSSQSHGYRKSHNSLPKGFKK